MDTIQDGDGRSERSGTGALAELAEKDRGSPLFAGENENPEDDDEVGDDDDDEDEDDEDDEDEDDEDDDEDDEGDEPAAST